MKQHTKNGDSLGSRIPIFFGLFFSFLLICASFFITLQVVMGDFISEIDLRILNLIVLIRTLAGAKFLLFFTYMGNLQIMAGIGIICVAILFLQREYKKILLFIFGSGFAILCAVGIKFLVHRDRPDSVYFFIPEDGYSFPSSHALVAPVFYGLITFFIYKKCAKVWQKTLLVCTYLSLITLVSFSRVYLGVHWASDVVAGSLLGSAFVMLLLIFFGKKCENSLNIKPIVSKKFLLICGALLFCLEFLFIGYFYSKHPLDFIDEESLVGVIDIKQSGSLEDIISQSSFPKFSRSTLGKRMEPLSLIIIGSQENLSQAFKAAGWKIADVPNTKVLVHSIFAALFNKPYPSAPVTPSFIDNQPEVVAFQKSTPKNSIRQRHHTRFWATSFNKTGTTIWVGTASFDSGLSHLISHKIKPQIDDERDLIKEDLLKTGLVQNIQEIQFIQPYHGKNQNGDPFFTDGKAVIVYLK